MIYERTYGYMGLIMSILEEFEPCGGDPVSEQTVPTEKHQATPVVVLLRTG